MWSKFKVWFTNVAYTLAPFGESIAAVVTMALGLIIY